jgi:hypothetical protein
MLLIFVVGYAKSQNLIPNPSFENINTVYCGIFSNTDIGYSVNYWHSPTGGSPDLFSTAINQSCWNFQPNSSYSGPIGLKGYQMPRTGNVMAGLFCYTIDGMNQREYIQTQLTNPLTPGNLYTLSFYVSLANNTEKYTDKIGAYLSDSPIISGNDQPLIYIPQVSSTTFISDTLNWVLVSGTFQAVSAINFLTIGNFNYDVNTSTGLNQGGGSAPGTYGAYYYIDDVSLTSINTNINYNSNNDFISVFPIPVSNNLNITVNNNDIYEVFIYDIFSREIYNSTFTGKIEIDTEQFAKGLYIYKLNCKKDLIKTGKLVIE